MVSVAPGSLTEVHLDGPVLARAWAASAEVVRFDEAVRGRPVPVPGVLLWGEISEVTESTTAESIAIARLTAGETVLPHDTRTDPAIVAAAGAIDRLRSAVDEPPSAADETRRRFGERADLPPLAEAALLFMALEAAENSGTESTASGRDRPLARRIAVHRLLRSRGLTRHTILPIIAGIRARTGGFATLASPWTHGCGGEGVDLFAESALDAIAAGGRLAVELESVHDEWAHLIGARHDSSAWPLADLLVEQPVVTAAYASARLGVTATAARTSIAALTDVGVLEPISTARRNQAWRAPAVIAAADALLDPGHP